MTAQSFISCPAPFTTYTIDRYDDVAIVKIVHCWFDEHGTLRTRTLEEYETLSRGATRSARKSIAKIKAQG